MTALLLFGDTERSPAMRHEVPLAIGDPFMFADIDGRRAVLTSSLERSRIAAALPDAELLDFTALGMRELIEEGHSRLTAQHEIVASVRSGFGHEPGSGPVPAGLPIQVDLFPRDEASGCWADMTRTFVVGEPTAEDAADPDHTNEGFQFALGHGVGLEVHEPPGLGLSGHEPFVAGDVVAIEPGLWDARIGGVRLEDLLLVTDDGSETLTRFSYALTPGR